MTTFDDILDGFTDELALERELGVWAVEIDRSLLAPAVSPPPVPVAAVPPPPPAARAEAEKVYDFVFLHDRPLSDGGVEMMAKIVAAMKKTPETAPVLFADEKPKARAYVVLGSEALRKWYPGMRAAPGQWRSGREGESVLVTYSPEYILRFGAATPAVKKIKTDMWTSLKGVMRRMQV